MKLKRAFLILLSSFAFLGLQACDNDSSFENAGEELDQGLDNTGDRLDQGIDNTQEGLNDLGDEIDNEL